MKKLFVLIILILLTIIPVCAYEISDYYSSDDLSDYYGTTKACTKDGSENDCRNGNEYKFYLKMYDMYYLYKNKYNVTLDLPLIMAALYYGNEQMPEMFASNLNEYDRSSLKNNDTVTNLDWEYDFKNDECYTYLNSNDNSFDMQILAKNMVTKKITYKCSDSDTTEDSDNDSSSDDSSSDSSEENSSSSEKSNNSIAEDKIFYIGDSWFELLNKYGDAKSSKLYFYAKSAKNADWVLTNYSSAKSEAYNGKSLKGTIPKDTSAFIVNFGLNGTSKWETTQKLINNLVKDYSGKTVYFIKVPHVGENYSYGNLSSSKMNSNIDNYNSKMKSYCSDKSGVEFIDPTKNIVSDNGKGYLKKDYASGSFHLNATGDKQWYKDIISGIKAVGTTTDSSDNSDSSSDSSSSSSSSGDEKTATDIETSNYDSKLKCDSGKLDKDSINATYELDLDKYDKFLLEFIKYKYHTEGSEIKECSSASNVSGSGTIVFDGDFAKPDNDTPNGVYEVSGEPKPWFAINYWSHLNKDDYVYPKDKSSGKLLGAWPKNYKSIPTQLSNYKVYKGVFIWPATPTDEKYQFVYRHLGIDVMADFGTPIYSPVDGQLLDSEWGGTVNRGSDETSYSVTIKPDKVYEYKGTKISEIFMTHMSGIINRCSWNNCSKKVKKGELIGFVGNAAGSSTSEGYASHVHITFYPAGNYGGGLYTESMEDIYEISPGTKRKAGG